TLAFIPLCLIAFLLVPILLTVIFGPSYEPAIPALQIIIWTILPMIIGSCYSVMLLIPAGKFNEFLFAAGVGATVNIILNIILIPKYSMLGAGMATIIAETMSMMTSAYLAQRVFSLNLFKYLLLPLLLSVLGLAPYFMILFITKGLSTIFQLSLSGVTFIGVYILLAFLLERSFIFEFAREIFRK
ncbi:MAG: polysaccharide biosynthesis C-terminal domain-containing protein, partial [bacterium]